MVDDMVRTILVDVIVETFRPRVGRSSRPQEERYLFFPSVGENELRIDRMRWKPVIRRRVSFR